MDERRKPTEPVSTAAQAAPASARPAVTGSVAALGFSALGVVFGDLGTSPLYTLKTVFAFAGPHGGPDVALGVLSLVVWTLIIIVMVKYVFFAMRVDNDGEGGILALLALLGVKRAHRPAIVAIGLFGAALIYGDGAITPAISVLSALEGLNIATPAVSPYVLPAAVVVLFVLFAVQPQGTARIGRAFGPVMAFWFVTIGLLGIWGIAHHPAVLVAIDPRYALRYLFSGTQGSFFVLGGVFLCVTGAEALYADMGHFGARPIRRAWILLVFPSLVLNYAGQVALVLEGAPVTDNIFYRLCPPLLLIPLVILATAATIIASQAIITGTFSMTRQAIQLGWMPRMAITQTSAEGYGQIYVGVVNWCLMLATLGVAIGFRKSDNLASAYGIAVSATMLLTTALLFLAMRELWRWSLFASCLVAGLFLVVDGSFFLANLAKIADGGYVPLLLAAFVYLVMMIWHWGAVSVGKRVRESVMPIADFMAMLERCHIARVPGTAVFLTRTRSDAPPVMVWHVKHNRALHEKLLVVSIEMQSVPWVHEEDRLTVVLAGPNFWRGVARFGFMERPDMPQLLLQANACGCGLDLHDVTYYVGHETVIAREDHKGVPRWVERLFSFTQRNSAHVSDYFRLPADHVVEIGREIAI
ncbi:MAG TPA: KUP/HAK/KT family potassium transporter [Rhizomicrobium sp.]|jgi:KUP system potassium uptake protein|nr:KUP/HAK/KT family potassium transporter [Rhizomicrobium sp.]